MRGELQMAGLKKGMKGDMLGVRDDTRDNDWMEDYRTTPRAPGRPARMGESPGSGVKGPRQAMPSGSVARPKDAEITKVTGVSSGPQGNQSQTPRGKNLGKAF
jgi:hypothetical protein